VTTAIAGGLLGGLWFVPSANATDDGAPARAAASQAQVRSQAQTAGPGDGVELADTGTFDSTPYLLGGFGFLGAGAALLVNARVRAGREGLTPAAR
jgi:hypothetical protein